MSRVLAILLLLTVTGASADQFEVDELFRNRASDAQLDKACAQKDCRTSRLFWYTKLEDAQQAAQRLGRPIISLHLLGRLDEELSCANSRFFRTILYSDPAIARLMRDEFVLHWHSVRPVPRITIDFGDGRKIQQTITGNSAHYLLTEHGAVLDVLPGLHSPGAFRSQLEEWVRLRRMVAQDMDGSMLERYHAEAINASTRRWSALSAKSAIALTQRELSEAQIKSLALAASRRAMSKARIERPFFAQLDLGQSLMTLQPSEWEKLGELEKESVTFAPESLAVIRAKQGASEKEMVALLDNLRRTVAAETIFNQLELHRRIHAWFANGEVSDLYSLNERIYDELFLTPSNDPWLGMREPSVFAALAQ